MRIAAADLTQFISEAGNSRLIDIPEKDLLDYVDSKINDLVGNAPAALNTLGKIKEAMNDDKNYAYGVRDFISRQRLQVFEGDGIRDQFVLLHHGCLYIKLAGHQKLIRLMFG